MKTITKYIFWLVIIFGVAACDKDGDKIYINSIEAGDLMASDAEVVLSQDNSKDIVLSLSWTRDDLVVSDSTVQAPNLISMTLQVSTSSDFSSNVLESAESSLSKAYTGAALNTVAKDLGATPEVANMLYFRLMSRIGDNMDPVYSKVISVSVTPYTIDMSTGYILDADQNNTGGTLSSAASDGEYVGFMGATGWYNYFLREGDGTIWGNDGVDGSAFLMSSADTKWNFWFPGLGGCYYVDVNTNKKVWSALYIPLLAVSGDIAGNMTFDRPNLKWSLVFTATQAGKVTFSVSGTGKLYDYSTSTEDNLAKDTPVGFTLNGENLTFGEQSGDITVDVPSVGECTLVIDLSNPKQWSASVVSGTQDPDEVRKGIYLSGIDDGLPNGSWNFNNRLQLYDEDTESYAGVAYALSLYGYNVFLEKDNWNDKYTFVSGDAYSGVMAFKGEGGNLPAPAEGLYFFNVSLKDLSYKLVSVGSQIYYSGLNDNWDLHPLTATSTSGVFSGSITIEKASEWGIQIILDTDWTYKYGGSKGVLHYKGNNITDDATLSIGTYTLTVDLINGTYTIK